MPVSKHENIQRRKSSKKSYIVTLAGVICLLVPLLRVFIDPIHMYINYGILFWGQAAHINISTVICIIQRKDLLSFQLNKGSYIYQLFTSRLEGERFHYCVFNYTNAKDFMAGKDYKLKLSEVGPFVFQEYRINEDIEIDEEAGTMTFSPKQWAEFIPEESVGDPKSIHVITPNFPMVPVLSALSKYPSFIKGMINMYAARVKFKPLINLTIQEVLWGYPDPLTSIANAVFPGLLNFDSIGMMERLYDNGSDYRMEISTTSASRFSIKKITKRLKDKSGAVTESISTYADTYEGIIFPPHMRPETPINIIRHSICPTFRAHLDGNRLMDYGAEAFAYVAHNSSFSKHQLCDGKGWCPDGLMTLAPCFFGLPLSVSKRHFLDGDPRLLERIEGFKPDRSKDESLFIIDPILGVTMTSNVFLQLSILMGDVEYNPEARRLKNMPLPIVTLTGMHPHMLEVEAKRAARILYIYGPYTVLIFQILFVILGVGILGYEVSVYLYRRTKIIHHVKDLRQNSKQFDQPLLMNTYKSTPFKIEK